MQTTSAPPSRRADLVPRVVMGLSGAAVIAASLFFASSYIDTGDSTCGSVLRPTNWLDNPPPACTPVMPIRALLTIAALVIGFALLVQAVRRRPVGPRWPYVALICVCGVIIMLLINEVVRSGGAL
jgi:hypothetical protein